MGKKIDNKRK